MTGKTVAMNPVGWRTIVSEVETLITSGYKVAKEMVLTDDMVYLSKAANALKCAVTSGFINTWYLIGAAYNTLSFVGQESLVTENVDAYYPTLCACLIEVDTMIRNLEEYGSFITGDPPTYYTAWTDSSTNTPTTTPEQDCIWPTACFKSTAGETTTNYYYTDTESCFDQGPWLCTATDGTCFLSAAADCSTQDVTGVTCADTE
jgi:hypothetical protein